MANNMRWRYGETNPVQAEVGESDVIEIGDLVALFSGKAKAAASLANTGTEAGNQEAFHDVFLGVAMQASAVGDTKSIRIATTGVFDFDWVGGSKVVGDFIGLDVVLIFNTLKNQTIKPVPTANLAIGRCAMSGDAASQTYVEIVSSVMRGGPQEVV